MMPIVTRRGVRVAYGDGLENRCIRKGTVGSNPTPSATANPSTTYIPSLRSSDERSKEIHPQR